MLTSAFVTEVRRQGSISAGYADADILLDGDREVRARFVPLLEEVRQNYLVRTATLTADALGKYPLPDRSVTAALRNVQLQLGNGSWVPLPQRALEDADATAQGQPFAYYVDAGSIVLLPTGASGTLRVRYAVRPGVMVLDTSASLAARIDSVSTGATTTTITTSPAFTGSNTVDVISKSSAHQHKAIGTTRAGLVLQNSDLLEAIVIGDYLVNADSTPFVPLPEELSAALVHRTAGTILRALGYDEEAARQLELAEDAITHARPMLIPRNEGNPQPIKGGIRRALSQGRNGRWYR